MCLPRSELYMQESPPSEVSQSLPRMKPASLPQSTPTGAEAAEAAVAAKAAEAAVAATGLVTAR